MLSFDLLQDKKLKLILKIGMFRLKCFDWFAISAQTVKMDEATFVQDWPENN